MNVDEKIDKSQLIFICHFTSPLSTTNKHLIDHSIRISLKFALTPEPIRGILSCWEYVKMVFRIFLKNDFLANESFESKFIDYNWIRSM